ncbi:protein translocase subunit SecF [Leifsonia bigeumensis]|uniref:Protein-export membrane protein SecF n=1 Tax=Leifsonella bigeumensis TaxID=433643 RepID=A0ABP7FQN5_9MICO
MTSRFARFGNDLHTGERSIDFVGMRRYWLIIASLMMIVAVIIPIVKGGFNFGIEFRGGSQFQVSGVIDAEQSIATAAVESVVPDMVARVSIVGSEGVRVQTDQLTDDETKNVATALAVGYGVDESEVTHSFIGPTWGADVSRQAIQGLAVFLTLALLLMAFYFRTWKMSLAAILSLVHDLIITAGVYALTGFEVTPAALIGFLTILAFSLYDTVVVFDKIKENTAEEATLNRRTFAETVNLGVNQTLVRSINTGVVAVLPVGTILFVGAFVLGADTLRDISLALLIGIILGTYSTIFVGAPLYAWFRQGEPEIRKHDAVTLATRTAVSQG